MGGWKEEEHLRLRRKVAKFMKADKWVRENMEETVRAVNDGMSWEEYVREKIGKSKQYLGEDFIISAARCLIDQPIVVVDAEKGVVDKVFYGKDEEDPTENAAYLRDRNMFGDVLHSPNAILLLYSMRGETNDAHYDALSFGGEK